MEGDQWTVSTDEISMANQINVLVFFVFDPEFLELKMHKPQKVRQKYHQIKSSAN